MYRIIIYIFLILMRSCQDKFNDVYWILQMIFNDNNNKKNIEWIKRYIIIRNYFIFKIFKIAIFNVKDIIMILLY